MHIYLLCWYFSLGIDVYWCNFRGCMYTRNGWQVFHSRCLKDGSNRGFEGHQEGIRWVHMVRYCYSDTLQAGCKGLVWAQFARQSCCSPPQEWDFRTAMQTEAARSRCWAHCNVHFGSRETVWRSLVDEASGALLVSMRVARASNFHLEH